MKTIKLTFILICSLLFANSNLQAQAPEKINYQAVARNLAGVPLVNQTINVKFEIRQGFSTGAVVYAENHVDTTNQFGLFTAEIGGGTPITGTFPGIAWGTSPFYLFVEVDGDPMGVTQLLSVPYALYAKESANGPAGLPGKNSLSLSTPYSGPSCINGGTQIDDGLDDNNDGTLQPLEIDYTYIICNGTNGTNGTNGLPGTNGTNGVDGISIDSTINNNDGTFSIYYSNGTSFTTSDLTGPAGTSGTTYFAGNGISLSGDTITNLGDLDNNPTNEIQILSINATQDTIFLSNGGYAVLPSSSTGLWSTFGGLNIHNNNPNNVGIGTTTPLHKLSVVSNDSVVASFIGTNPNVSAIVVANVNPSAATGIVFFNGVDTTSYIFLNPTNNALAIRNNSLNGNILISTDSVIVNQGLILANQAQYSIYNETDTIYSYSPSGTIVNVNQGMFLTDSLYVLGNNAANINWVLANDGFGQAKWTDPSTIVGSVGDNWGTQTVNVDNTTIFGDGDGTPLSGFDGQYSSLTGTPTNVSAFANDVPYLTTFTEVDADTTNEIQNLSISGTDTIALTISGPGGNSVYFSNNDADFDPTNEIELPTTAVANQVLTWDGSAWVAQNPGSGADNWGSQVVVTDGTTITGTGIAGDTLRGFDGQYSSLTGAPTNVSAFANDVPYLTTFTEVDADTTNELQVLSFVDPILTLSKGGGSVNLGALTGPTYTAGLGISLTGDTITNTAPNIIVGLAGAGTTSIGGAYPNFTITSTEVDGSVSNELITSFGVNGTSDSLVIKEAGNEWAVPLASFSAAGKWSENAGDLYPTTLTNNVGIGTATPGSKLDVLNNTLNSGVNISSTGALAGNLYGMQVSSSNGIVNNKYGIVSTASGTGGNQYGLNGIASGAGAGTTYAVYGQNTATNTGNAFAGSFENTSTSAANKYGVYGVVAANGGQQFGVAGSVTGGGTGVTYGVSGNNSTSSTGDSYGGYFSNINASSTSNSYGIFTQSISANNNTKYGILASTNGGSVSATKYAVYGAAGGSGTVNYGIYGTANGATTNYAGYFDQGDVLINNTLILPTGASTGFVLTSDLVGNASWQPAAASGAWTSNGTQTFLNSNNDFVGIGTNNPLSKLHIQGTSDPLEVVLDNGGGAFKTGYTIKTGAGQKWFMGKELNPDFVIKDETVGQVRLNITTAGNVGIGTTLPESMLHIALPNTANHKAFQLGHGNQPTLEWLFKVDEFSLLSIANENNGAEYTAMAIDANNGNVGIGTIPTNNARLEVDGGGTAGIRVEGYGINGGGLHIVNTDGVVQDWSLLGLGTSGFFGPSKGFAISDITSGTNPFNIEVGTPNNTLYLKNSGNVGIGTNNPSFYRLSIHGENPFVRLQDDVGVGAGTSIGISFNDQNAAQLMQLDYQFGKARFISWLGGSDIEFLNNTGSGTQTRMTISGVNGFVGIGTTTPTAKLHIGGVAGTDGIRFPDGTLQTTAAAGSSGWNLTGNTGTVDGTDFIGTTDNVALNFRVNNQKVGRIESNTWTGGNFVNTFFGYLTGNSNTTGSENTASGAYSLYSNTTGNLNTASGLYSLYSNTIGIDNTASGSSSLFSNVAGNNATAIGSYAMYYANNTATAFTNYNVAVGYEALRGSNTPASNTGNTNTAIGYQSLMNNTAGSGNTAIGYGTLINNTTSTGNTVLGYGAGSAFVNGNSNTFIGYNTGASANGFTNSTAIGAGATVGQSNSLILGSGANVGIGTSTPTAKLDVNGTITISGANTNELNRAQTGAANLVPIAYGSVTSGAVIANAGTGNWTVVAGGAGQYTITVTGETFIGSSHVMSGTMNGTYGFISLIAFTNNILVQTTNTGGANQNAAFSFIVYKP